MPFELQPEDGIIKKPKHVANMIFNYLYSYFYNECCVRLKICIRFVNCNSLLISNSVCNANLMTHWQHCLKIRGTFFVIKVKKPVTPADAFRVVTRSLRVTAVVVLQTDCHLFLSRNSASVIVNHAVSNTSLKWLWHPDFALYLCQNMFR
jgi:hypothetical protein